MKIKILEKKTDYFELKTIDKQDKLMIIPAKQLFPTEGWGGGWRGKCPLHILL